MSPNVDVIFKNAYSTDSYRLVNCSHGCVGMTVAAWSMPNLSISQPLVVRLVASRWDDTQNLKLKLQCVVRRGER